MHENTTTNALWDSASEATFTRVAAHWGRALARMNHDPYPTTPSRVRVDRNGNQRLNVVGWAMTDEMRDTVIAKLAIPFKDALPAQLDELRGKMPASWTSAERDLWCQIARAVEPIMPLHEARWRKSGVKNSRGVMRNPRLFLWPYAQVREYAAEVMARIVVAKCRNFAKRTSQETVAW